MSAPIGSNPEFTGYSFGPHRSNISYLSEKEFLEGNHSRNVTNQDPPAIQICHAHSNPMNMLELFSKAVSRGDFTQACFLINSLDTCSTRVIDFISYTTSGKDLLKKESQNDADLKNILMSRYYDAYAKALGKLEQSQKGSPVDLLNIDTSDDESEELSKQQNA
jgi:hypothetical protein